MAIEFDSASSERYTVASTVLDDSYRPLSISFWVKLTTITGAGAYAFFSGSEKSSNNGRIVYTYSALAAYFTSGLLTTTALTAATGPKLGEWAHIGVWESIDPIYARKVYVNGTPSVTASVAKSSSPIELELGVWHDGGSYASHLDGTMSNLTVWKGKQLSDDNFTSLSKGVNPYTIHPEFIAHHWPLSGDGPVNVETRDVVGGINFDTVNGTPDKVDSIKLRGNRLF